MRVIPIPAYHQIGIWLNGRQQAPHRNAKSALLDFNRLPMTPPPSPHFRAQLVLPALANPRAFCELFLDYFRFLFCAHVSKTYGPSFEETSRFRGGLAPWQKKRVTQLVFQHHVGASPLKWQKEVTHRPSYVR